MRRARIVGMGRYAPEHVLTNAKLETMVDTTDAWILQRSGIRERHIAAENEATSDLALRAARTALTAANLRPTDIDFIVVGTTTPDMFFPTTAALLQHQLGCGRAGAVDLSAGCAASIYSLAMGAQFIQTGKYRRVLCVGAETLSRIVDYTDRATCVLMGDAAGAVILEAADDGDAGILDVDLHADGRHSELLQMPAGGSRHPAARATIDARMHYVKMKGSGIFKVAIRTFAECAQAILARHGFTPADLALFVPHQANLRMIEAAAGRLDLPMEKVFVNVDRYGNTGAASLFVALAEASATGRLKRGDLVLLASVGAGLSWGAALVRW